MGIQLNRSSVCLIIDRAAKESSSIATPTEGHCVFNNGAAVKIVLPINANTPISDSCELTLRRL